MASRKLLDIFHYIERHQDVYIKRLAEAVSIKSVSGWAESRSECARVIQWMADNLKKLGATCDIWDNPSGQQILPNGSTIPYPPILTGRLGEKLPSAKPTVLIYGHLDVQPALKADGWNTDPFTMVEADGKLFGRGTSDDKGPVIAYLNCFEAFKELNMQLPVNIKFIFEAMEETGSEGIYEMVSSLKDSFFTDVDYVCVTDTRWLGRTKPCIGYGLRGYAYFNIEVTCSSNDLHSGMNGGLVHEAVSDVVVLMNSLIDKNGRILVPGIYDDVAPVTDDERKLYENIDFDLDSCMNQINTTRLLHDSKEDVLMHMWRYPAISMHGIESASGDLGNKSVIPRKAIGKFTILMVPNQKTDDVAALVKEHLLKKHAELGSPNACSIRLVDTAEPWYSDFRHPHFEAAQRAVKEVYGVDADMVRNGGSVPVTNSLQEASGKSVILLPVGASDDGAHGQNEKINISNYINGTKLMAAYLCEMGNLEKT